MVLGGSGGGTIGRPKTEQLGQHTRRAKDQSELLQAVNVLIIAGCARSQREVLNGCVDLSICLVFSVIAATTLPLLP